MSGHQISFSVVFVWAGTLLHPIRPFNFALVEGSLIGTLPNLCDILYVGEGLTCILVKLTKSLLLEEAWLLLLFIHWRWQTIFLFLESNAPHWWKLLRSFVWMKSTESPINTAWLIHCSLRFWGEEWELKINSNTMSMRWGIPECYSGTVGAWKRPALPGPVYWWRSCVLRWVVERWGHGRVGLWGLASHAVGDCALLMVLCPVAGNRTVRWGRGGLRGPALCVTDGPVSHSTWSLNKFLRKHSSNLGLNNMVPNYSFLRI